MKFKDLHTKYIGTNILHYPVLTSTNDKCKEIYKDVPSGTIIISDIQTNGRGKQSRHWYSPSGGIYLSIIIKPEKNLSKDLNKLPLVTAVALCQTLKSLEINTYIKWPNDIIFENKKLAGILCESKFKGSNLEYIIVGIGININSVLNNSDLTNIFTSLKKEFNKDFDKNYIISILLNNFEKYFTYMIDGKFHKCLKLYKLYCLILNKQVKLIKENSKEIVKVLDINENGSLKVLDSSNLIKDVFSSDVSLRGLIGYI